MALYAHICRMINLLFGSEEIRFPRINVNHICAAAYSQPTRKINNKACSPRYNALKKCEKADGRGRLHHKSKLANWLVSPTARLACYEQMKVTQRLKMKTEACSRPATPHRTALSWRRPSALTRMAVPGLFNAADNHCTTLCHGAAQGRPRRPRIDPTPRSTATLV